MPQSLEVARVDDERMEELKRKVGSGKAFGTRVDLVGPKKVKELFPLVCVLLEYQSSYSAMEFDAAKQMPEKLLEQTVLELKGSRFASRRYRGLSS